MNVIVIDAGNTHVRFGIFSGLRLKNVFQVPTKKCDTAAGCRAAMSAALSHAGISARRASRSSAEVGVCIASVVPRVNSALRRACREVLKTEPLFISHKLNTGIALRYKNPAQIGADRIANAIAAHAAYGAPCIVVDFGTATTLDVIGSINSSGERCLARGRALGAHRGKMGAIYLGGVIAPGPVIGAQALFERTAKLPKVEVRTPARAVGRTTAEAIQSGLMFGYAGLVDGLVCRVAAELARRPSGASWALGLRTSARRPVIVATGGLARQMAPLCRTIKKVDPELTMRGIRLFWELNRHK